MDAVLNWIWQGSVIALGTAVMLRAMEAYRAGVRYGVVWAALLSVLVLPLAPIIWESASAAPASGDIPVHLGPVVSMPLGWWSSSTVVIGLWALWFGVFACRAAAAVWALRRAKRRCRPAPPALEGRLRYWMQVSTHGRRTRLVLSNDVRSAAVLGCGSPVIAVRPAVVERLSDEELDRVVIHEWAHVQRRDDLANALQLCVRVIAGWHPAVWWLDRQLHLEREAACDETAVAVTGSAKGYAACLATLASLPAARGRSWPALAALSSSDLRHRIVRILSPRHATGQQSWPMAAATGAAVVLGVIALTVAGVRFVDAAGPTTDVVQAAPTQPVTVTAVSGPVTPRPVMPSELLREPSGPRVPASMPRVRQDRPRPTDAAVAGAEPTLSTAASSALRVSTDPAAPPALPEEPLLAVTSTPPVIVVPLESPVPSTRPIGSPASNATAPTTDMFSVSPWAAAADAGASIGRGSQNAAIATAGAFSRFGKKIAGAF